MKTKPGEGERRAAGGYRPQYLVGAAAILAQLKSGDLEWIRVADPEVGRVDDLQIASTARLDAYQVKWTRYSGAVTLRDLIRPSDNKPPLVAQLADGWQRLRAHYPYRRVVVHLVTNEYPSIATQGMPPTHTPPAPYHLSAFIEQAWLPARRTQQPDIAGPWAAVWKALCTASGLTEVDFLAFVADCVLDLRTPLPKDEPDVLILMDLLFATAAGTEHLVELTREQLLQKVGWTRRYTSRNVHEFPAPLFLYRPIQNTVNEIETALKDLTSGYVGVFGPPGSGKSTLLTRTLRALPLRLIRYYAYVPEAQDPSILRGESANFLHDVTLRLQEAGICRTNPPDPADRSALLSLFHEQLQALGDDFVETGTKTVIMVDGLDHIAREQHPERSLLFDLPLPQVIPSGVYIVLGSQTDQLPSLPPRVDHALQQAERRIEMGRLTPADTDAIAQEAVSVLDSVERQRVYSLSDGHPLALIYLLKQLRQADQAADRAKLLAETVPYCGDIEQQYWAHWRDIEHDEVLVQTLGLLARVRGAISMAWVAGWSEKTTLRKLQQLLLTYFQREGENRWVFFHNSFRLFLVERTADPLPGQSPAQQHHAYHRELAERYEASPAPWRWEALYHRYNAGEYALVVGMGTWEWFSEQITALRPLDAIQTDVWLALQAAGTCGDVIALAGLTLTGAALEQRTNTLEDRILPDILLDLGESDQATAHLRDGNRLRVDTEQALRLSIRLIEAGLDSEGRRIFDLAEPLELLSGRAIPDDHTRPQNLWDLLGAWVRSAVVFRGPAEVVLVVRRIRLEATLVRQETENAEQASRQFQNWLLFQGALACADRGDRAGWQTLYDALDASRDKRLRFFTLLRSAEHARDAGETDRARGLLQNLLAAFEWRELEDDNSAYWQIEARIAVIELALDIAGDEPAAREWATDLGAIPLQDSRRQYEEQPSLHLLRFRAACLRYRLGAPAEPRELVQEAEQQTSFGRHTESDEKARDRQIALALYQLARLWAWGQGSLRLPPTAFLEEVRWILDFVGPGFARWLMPLRLAAPAARSAVLKCLIQAAVAHGAAVLTALRDELHARWIDPTEIAVWPIDLQRELVLALGTIGVDHAWATTQLQRIAPIMLRDLDPNGRVEECEQQARAWLALDAREEAFAELGRMLQAARGVLSEDDYQLSIWVEWLGRVNRAAPQHAETRNRLMLRRILSVQGSASGVHDGAEKLLEVIFQWSPQRATSLLKGLLELQTVGHQGGVAHLLKAALEAELPPVTMVLHTLVDLLLPFVPGTEADLVEALIEQTAKQFGVDPARTAARYLVGRIKSDALVSNRPGWQRGVAAGLGIIGSALHDVGLQPFELEDRPPSNSNTLDQRLGLRGGGRLDLSEVMARVQAVADLRTLLEAQDQARTVYFDWSPVIEHLLPQLSSPADLVELTTLVRSHLHEERRSRALVGLSKRYQNLGNHTVAWQVAEEAFDATKASGWDPYWDGGARHAALRQLIAVDARRARARAVSLYAQDLAERFRHPGRIVPHLYNVLALLTEDVPVTKIWPAIETHLNDLFASITVDPQQRQSGYSAHQATSRGKTRQSGPSRIFSDFTWITPRTLLRKGQCGPARLFCSVVAVQSSQS